MRRLHGPVDEGQLRDVVLVDHAEHGLLLAHVDLRVPDLLLVGRLQLAEAIITNQVGRFLLRLAVDGSEGGRQAARAETVDVGFPLSFLQSKT